MPQNDHGAILGQDESRLNRTGDLYEQARSFATIKPEGA